MPERLVVDPTNPNATLLMRAARLLRLGGLVAFPTETVYGLGAHALNTEAVARIYEVKGRPAASPLIVHVARRELADDLVTAFPAAAEKLARAFWPGPLTLVLPRADRVPYAVTGGLDTVGIRVPGHPVTLALLRMANAPVAAPSANRYRAVSPTTAQHVLDGLGEDIDLLVDGGPCPGGIESTVVSVVGRPKLLRRGLIDAGRLRAVVGDLDEEPDEGPARSPGMDARHYAPRARLVVVDEPRAAPGVGAVVRGEGPEQTENGGVSIALPGEPEGFGAGLYAALHRLDAAGCREIQVQTPPPGVGWDAIRDRLARGSQPG